MAFNIREAGEGVFSVVRDAFGVPKTEEEFEQSRRLMREIGPDLVMGATAGGTGKLTSKSFGVFIKALRKRIAEETLEETLSKAATNLGRGGTLNPIEARTFNEFAAKSLEKLLK